MVLAELAEVAEAMGGCRVLQGWLADLAGEEREPEDDLGCGQGERSPLVMLAAVVEGDDEGDYN